MWSRPSFSSLLPKGCVPMSPPFMPRPSAKKWWPTQLGVEIPISQWGEVRWHAPKMLRICHFGPRRVEGGGWGGIFFWNLVFPIVPSCSHHFLNGLIIMFSICSSGSQCIPNSTTCYHITFMKSSPPVTYKNVIEEKTTIYISTLGVPKDWSNFLGWCTNQRGPSPKTMNKTLEVPTSNQYEPH